VADETRIGGRTVRPSGSPAAEKPVVRQPDQVSALAQKYGLQPGMAGANEERVLVFADVPDADQPTVFTAKNMWANLPKSAFNQVTTLMNQYYGEGRWSLSGGAGKPGVKGFWEMAVDVTRAQANLGKRVPVIQAFDQILANSAAAGLTPGGAAVGGGGGGGGAPQITKSVNLTDPGTAETLIDQALQQYLGRRASNDEVREFRKALRKAERGAPREADIEGDTQVTSGGFNAATFAQQYAEGMEGAAEYQAATTFLDSFIESLGARVDVV
jgi:hypothetical protein